MDFLDRFTKNDQISNFIKILSLAAELFYANGEADMAKLITAFYNFANSPKNMHIHTCEFFLPFLVVFLKINYFETINC